MNALPVIAVVVPLALALAVVWPAARRAAAVLAPWAPAPALACALWPTSIVLEAPQWLLGLRFGLDETGRTFLLFTALLWLVAGWAARAYHADDARRHAMWAFWLAALAGNVWLIVALDAAGFYTGFALMTFAGYGLVVHTGSDEAKHAGRVYVVLAVLGEAALLAGLLLRVGAVGNATLPLPALAGAYDTWAVALLFAGFGVKAGAAGLHMWLPLAHPVAPTPASSVLSGAMIKAGVLGWMRFLPLGVDAWPALGSTAITLGLAAMFGAVAVGLMQRAPKTLLAYSSVSQMGFLTAGIGAALLAPQAWPALAAAVTLYALHHGLAKGALFLGVAAIPAAGRARACALIALALPALALAGAPFTSGALAKAELKAALAALPPPWPEALDWLLPAAAAGTTLLLARFLVAQAALRPAAKRGMALPWLAAVACAAFVAWTVAPAARFDAGALWAAAAPLLAGGAIAGAVARFKPFAPDARPALPAGDLLHWLTPLSAIAWQALLRAAGFADTLGAAHRVPSAGALPLALARGERELRRFAVAGAVLLLLLAALAATVYL
jgi:formate hydrogenlyase subunit 3/multisubunit Na+/H+ antiporter MnhD subunit